MRFRPCIDIHNGTVKQIVGGSLKDEGDQARTNFASDLDAAWYARQYRKDGLKGGHIILLNPETSPYYKETKRQALEALRAYPGGMQIGGGITPYNAEEYLKAGATHVIVTSYVFRDGKMDQERLKELVHAVGTEHLVLDLSCRKKDGDYYVVTDRWQKFTEVCVNAEILDELSAQCDEFLIHGVDVEGKASGVEKDLVRLLAEWGKRSMTYAGGIGSLEELQEFADLSRGKLDYTIGSALDLFGGTIPYRKIVEESRI
ncbi:phosphoribosylformimino-5-aminoimidazole carboxamide ribotide isomerase [Dorea sp. OM02-2LB]|nr:phosphoribosylformimino-5-aminoimidazole carboxamide ribotide isomerase [uncultured Mediterraneibacter sp.]RGO23949.1 phosphoribosylformimino-5-aminoimidazole carboxamide ribotide isomerase [Dorea sp. OM02-2LB]RGV95748.1 phosphoribosylformimino-5-aminoimidazole carboxamide ribotide isomerase [Ruminococcus sp. AF14-10]